MLWVDKYRPVSLDRLTFHEGLNDRLHRLVSLYYYYSFGVDAHLACVCEQVYARLCVCVPLLMSLSCYDWVCVCMCVCVYVGVYVGVWVVGIVVCVLMLLMC